MPGLPTHLVQELNVGTVPTPGAYWCVTCRSTQAENITLSCWWLILPIQIVKKNWKIFETISHRYPARCTQRELSNEYLHDRVNMGFRVFCAVVP